MSIPFGREAGEWQGNSVRFKVISNFQIRNNFMFGEDKVVYNRGSIKIKVIRGEMEVGERDRSVAVGS